MTEKKKLEILIGDDDLYGPIKQLFEEQYANLLRKNLPEYLIEIDYDVKPEKVISQAKIKRYDVVVTDLDYTGMGGKQGYDVINQIVNQDKKPVLILCTSSDNYAEIEQRTAGKINYHAGRGKGHKFMDLIEILTQHYKK